MKSRFMAIRHVISIAVLPGTVMIAVPIWIAQRQGVRFAPPTDIQATLICVAGAILLAVGAFLFGWSLFYFWSRGRGTLAPRDPPKAFGVAGPYPYVRNPMITGVILVLLGGAGVVRSRPHLAWAVLVALINAVYIPLIEEPMLEERFGAAYRKYMKSVRRFLPSLRPWSLE